ncbi:heterokaryon incompatibility protein [Botrytis cinerea]
MKHRYYIRLCNKNIPPNSKYATLSHVWGNVNFVKLLKSNLASFKEDIPMSSLSKTFQDAIKLALRFGFHYLWIDSLCIIQDNGDDWLKESALMASIYGGSSLNISATGAQNGNEGLFFERDLNSIRTVNLMTQVEGQKNCSGLNDSNGDNSRLADKLIALSGVAKHFANKYNVEYLAGIWREHLPLALLWSVDDKNGTGSLPLRGPSWSWASRNGSIRYDRLYSFVTTPYDDRPSPWEANDFKILDVQVRTTPDLYGHCLCGTMRIECVSLLDGTETSGGLYPNRTSKTVHIGEGSFSINYYFDDWRDHHKIYLLKIFSRKMMGNSKLSYQRSRNAQWGALSLLPQISGVHNCEEGLIIAPVARKKGIFTRVGVYQTPGYSGTLQDFENMRNKGRLSLENELSLYQEVSGVNKAGDQMYIITLI